MPTRVDSIAMSRGDAGISVMRGPGERTELQENHLRRINQTSPWRDMTLVQTRNTAASSFEVPLRYSKN